MTTEPRLIVPEGAPREVWHAHRGEGVTASRVWAIARGGISTWRRELEQQMNGSTFRGTAATKAGGAREAALLDEAIEHDPTVKPNSALWGSGINDLHRATPDGIGADVVIEVKSHAHGWDSEAIPPEHMGQMQWQIHVLGKSHALYGFEVRDEDDQPPVDGATWIDVPRDDEMIAWLIERANLYIWWRESGCPETLPMPDDLAEANKVWTELKVQLNEVTAAEKAAATKLKTIVAKLPYGKRFGAIGMGETGGFQISVTTKNALDEKAWEKAEPDGYAVIVDARAALAAVRAAALTTIEAEYAALIEMVAEAEAVAEAAYVKTTATATLRLQEPEKEPADV